jgi:hypothetical protein
MKPSNQEERKKAFMNFLLFFMLTIGVILTSVFFSFKVPLKENDQLRAEALRMDNERVILSQFETKMQQTMTMLDTLNESGSKIAINDAQITSNIRELSAIISDSITAHGFYRGLIANLSNVQLLKQQLRDSNNKDNDEAQMKATITRLQDQLQVCNNQVMTMNAMLRK